MSTKAISNTNLTQEEQLRERLYVALQQDGGNPSQLLDLLCTIVKKRPWEGLGLTFQQFIEQPFSKGGVGWSRKSINTILDLEHRYEHSNKKKEQEMKSMRSAVRELINPELAKRGRPEKGDNITFNEARGTDATYTLRRLKRDNPELAKRVIAGEMKANAAAIQAGFREKTITVPLNAEKAARTLLRHFSGKELKQLISLLSQG